MIFEVGTCRIHLSFCLEHNSGCVNYNNIAFQLEDITAGTSIPNTPSIENVYIFETILWLRAGNSMMKP